jgi:hypothetical protein
MVFVGHLESWHLGRETRCSQAEGKVYFGAKNKGATTVQLLDKASATEILLPYPQSTSWQVAVFFPDWVPQLYNSISSGSQDNYVTK